MRSGREQEERRRGEETRRGEEKRGEEEEKEDEKREEKEEDEEEATDIKSNNPHLAGGEKDILKPWRTNHGLEQHLAVCQNLVPLVNIKIAGKWMFMPLKMVLIGIDPYPFENGCLLIISGPRTGAAPAASSAPEVTMGYHGLPQELDGFMENLITMDDNWATPMT